MQRWWRRCWRRRSRRRRRAALIKSNNPHLAGGEFHCARTAKSRFFKSTLVQIAARRVKGPRAVNGKPLFTDSTRSKDFIGALLQSLDILPCHVVDFEPSGKELMEIVAESKSSVYHALLLRHSAPKLAWLKEQTLELAKCHAETEVAQPQEPSGDDGRDQVQELASTPRSSVYSTPLLSKRMCTMPLDLDPRTVIYLYTTEDLVFSPPSISSFAGFPRF